VLRIHQQNQAGSQERRNGDGDNQYGCAGSGLLGACRTSKAGRSLL